MSRSWRRKVIVLALAATIVGLVGVTPALATYTPGAPSSPGNIQPTVVGRASCSKVGSLGAFQFRAAQVSSDIDYVIPGGPTIAIDAALDQKTFSWTISPGWEMFDVTVTGSMVSFDHFDYEANGGPSTSDGALHAPLLAGELRKLTSAYFCYSPIDAETMTISGTKFHDENIDGLQGGTEEGLGEWTITARPIEGEGSFSTTTNAEGNWELSVPEGTYTVCETTQSGWSQSYPDGTVCDDEGSEPGGHIVSAASDVLDFGNYVVTELACGDVVNLEGGNSTASFTRLTGEGGPECGPKEHATEITDLDEVIFVPGNEDGGSTSTYEGTITFFKPLQNPIPPLVYDQNVFEGDGPYTPVPTCVEGVPPVGDTWCITDVEVGSADGILEITWSLFGVGDPRFK